MKRNHVAKLSVDETLGYQPFGNGLEHVLVLHDWNGDHTSYDPIVPYLDGVTFTYAFVDLRGYGLSRHISGNYTISEISQDCLALTDLLGWDQFHVIGHSMTGMAVQRIAVDAPKRVKSAIAVCPMSAAGSAAGEVALNFSARVRPRMMRISGVWSNTSRTFCPTNGWK
jgi:3-oxoadipate enol-lactonase